ncbi:hypothetical protein BUY00_02415 [Staphylococcus chromogenes]|nr:hypothetical protein BUY01_07035 [Staphylococcus chromogenes]PTF70135.1 hypothetical protein BUY03_06735 [Staphylococcus chromogenes]PTF75809.1 hypothetical protein BUX97_04935 [Staphylococcus chromogenes]PTG08076.1 hypothetical protein BU648_04750 [Staphylococcus chromogenes]PTG52082.1 hypothetical protein BU679_04595 [Staphylococcus chromogenes]
MREILAKSRIFYKSIMNIPLSMYLNILSFCSNLKHTFLVRILHSCIIPKVTYVCTLSSHVYYFLNTGMFLEESIKGAMYHV